MAKFSESFDVFMSPIMIDTLSSFYQDGYLVSYQVPHFDADFEANGISYLNMPFNTLYIEDEDGNLPETEFIAWTLDKLNSDHTVIYSGEPSSFANKVFGFPFAVKRTGSDEHAYFSAMHILSTEVKFQSYNIGSQEVTYSLVYPFSEQPELPKLNKLFKGAIPRSEKTDWYIDGLDPDFSKLEKFEDYAEIDLELTSMTRTTITLLNTSAASEVELRNVMYIAPKNQRIFLLPLGKIVNGSDKYTSDPLSEGLQSWIYNEDKDAMGGDHYVSTPLMRIKLENIGDVAKMIIIIWRDDEVNNYGYEVPNGIAIIPRYEK